MALYRGLLPGVGLALALATTLSAAPAKNATRTVGTRPTDDPARVLHVPRGFRAELAVTTPAIGNPSAITFDENGRLFALGSAGEVLLLSDTNSPGRYDTVSIFAENIPSATALICANGGLFVAAGNRIIFLQDTNGDGVADIDRIALTAPSTGSGRSIQNFVWRPDGHIIAVGAGFSFDPRTLQVSPEVSIGEQSLCLDEQGRAILCARGQPFQTVMYDSRYTARNNLLPVPNQVQNVLGLDDAVRVTGACMIYRGLVPTNYVRNLLIADPERNSVHSLSLQDERVEISAQKPGADFITSDDPDFAPKQIIAGPGGVYILDGQAGRSGQGRIWRLVPEGVAWVSLKPGKAMTYDLVASLAATDSWRRDTAARLLCERRDRASLPLLGSVLRYAKIPEARLAALQTLNSLGGLTEDFVITALQDRDERVRAEAVLISEKFLKNREVSPQIVQWLASAAQDPSEWVRYQLAFTLGEISSLDKPSLLAGILNHDPADAWIQTAILSSSMNGGGQLFAQLATDPAYRESASGADFLQKLLDLVGVRNQRDDVSTVLQFIENGRFSHPVVYPWLCDLSDGLRRGGSSLGEADPAGRLGDFYHTAFIVACDDTAAPALRLAGLRLFEAANYGNLDAVDYLLRQIIPAEPPEIQVGCIHAVARYNTEQLAGLVLQRRLALTPVVRAEMVAALLTRNNNASALLTELERGRILFPADFSSVQVNFLRTYGDENIERRAINIFGPPGSNGVERVKQFAPALKLTGSADRGHVIYDSRCADCHSNGKFGPPLAYKDNPNREKILSDILDPNATITTGYSTYVVELHDGEKLVGLMTDPAAQVSLLKQSDGNEVLLPQAGKPFITRQSWSLMPEEASEGLSNQDMADLIEYVAGLR